MLILNRFFVFRRCKGRHKNNALLVPSVDENTKKATTEKTKGFSPIGKNPYNKIPKFFR